MPIDPTSPRQAGRKALLPWVVGLSVLATFGLTWACLGELGMTWDEPYFFERQHDIGRWLGEVFGDPAARGRALSRDGMERAWRVARAVPDQHPPVPELLSLATNQATGWLVGPLRADRLSTVILFAVAAGVLFRVVDGRCGPWPALAAVGALVFDPRPFAHAQQITADSDTGAFWFLAAASYLRSVETGRKPWAFGLLAGLAIMCKATGVLLFPATLLWALIHRPKGWWKPLAWSAAVTPMTMVATMPPWWTDPVGGIARWVNAFLAYPQKVPVYYLGHVYDSTRTFMPWHNSLVLVGSMVPVGLLGLAIVGLASARSGASKGGLDGPGRLADRAVVSWAAIHFGTWVTLRALPILPAHDGLRQMVPSFFFLPVLVGFGARPLVARPGRLSRWAGRVAVAACVGGAGWSTLSIHPYELSYYNILIGGPRGAKAAGMESTYFWDAANAEVLDWMNRNLPRDATVLIAPPPNIHTFDWEQRRGRLRRDLRFLNLDPPDGPARLTLMAGPDPCFLLLQMRQGLYMPREGEPPGLLARLAEAPARFSLEPRSVGVRLLAIYDRDDFARALGRSPGSSPARPEP